MNYTEWANTLPAEIRDDPLWNVEAYRLALFSADLCWQDATRLLRDGRTLRLTAQLLAPVGSVGANISEGYSRGHQKDRARFYEYALGSARESRTWYFDSRHILGESVSQHRIRLQTQIIKLLLTMLPATRGYSLHEDDSSGATIMNDDSQTFSETESADLFNSAPLPET